MKEKDKYFQLPINLAQRQEIFADYNNVDMTLISYILYNKRVYTYDCIANIRLLLPWMGYKQYPQNIRKVKEALARAQGVYLKLTHPFTNADVSVNDLNVDTVFQIGLTANITPLFDDSQFKRIPIANIEAIVSSESYNGIDLSVYYILLASAQNYGEKLNLASEISSMYSNCYSVERMGAILGVSAITVKKSIERLEELKIIYRDNTRFIAQSGNGFFSKPTTYRFALL